MWLSCIFSSVRPVPVDANRQMPGAAQPSHSPRANGPVQPVWLDAADGETRWETLIDPSQSANALQGTAAAGGSANTSGAAAFDAAAMQGRAGMVDSIASAAGHGRTDMVRGADLDAALLEAMRSGNAAAVESLLQAAANRNTPIGSGAALEVLQSCSLEMARIFMDANAFFYLCGPRGVTPLMLAAERGNAGLVDMLLEDVSDIDAEDHYGYTALMVAARWGRTEIAARLLEAGASLFSHACNGDSPLSLAQAHGNTETCDMLMQAFAQSLAAGTAGAGAAAAGANPLA